MKKNVLIIGGLGYVGSVLFSLFEVERENVKILDNHLYEELDPRNSYIKADTRAKDQIEDIIKDFDVVVNLAAIVGNPGCLVDTDLAIDINCIGTKNVAEICKKYNKKIIHISTCSIYGNEPDRIVTEEDEGFPVDFYGQTKYTQERLVREICEEDYCILRLGTVYGLSPRMRYDLIVNYFTGKAVNEKKITVFGGNQKRPFVHIKDVANAIIFAIKNDLKGIYNVPGENLKLIQIANTVKEVTNCIIEIKEDIIDKRSYFADNSKILKKGFEFKYRIIDGIHEISESNTVEDMNEPIYSNLSLCEMRHFSTILRDKKPQIMKSKNISIDGFNTCTYDFNYYGVRRFDQILNLSNSKILAWNAHLKQAKYFFIQKGAALICAVKLDDIKKPSKNNKNFHFTLSGNESNIVFIPPGYAYGFKLLEENTNIYSFSTNNTKQTKNDCYIYPIDYWGKEIWELK